MRFAPLVVIALCGCGATFAASKRPGAADAGSAVSGGAGGSTPGSSGPETGAPSGYGGGASGGGSGSGASSSSGGVGGVAFDGGGLPGYGDACDPSARPACAPAPPGMTCTDALASGSDSPQCLVPCTASDSSACPYLTACGDPNLPGYCSPLGSGTCTPWSSCALGPQVTGLCVPWSGRVVCAARGSLPAFAPCDPLAANVDAAALCGTGLLCVSPAHAPQTLAASLPAGSGLCYPLCGAGGPRCPEDDHCDEPPAAQFGFCLPGEPCTLGSGDACRLGWSCVPDSTSSLRGGCEESGADAGEPGSPCAPSAQPGGTQACALGTVCVNLGSGPTCERLCGLDGGLACPQGTCTPLPSTGGEPAIGACE